MGSRFNDTIKYGDYIPPDNNTPNEGRLAPILEVLFPFNDTSVTTNGSNLGGNATPGPPLPATSVGPWEIIGLSCFFCVIGVIGVVGNVLVIFIILTDRKMRRSVTNLFIMNLAMSDLLIMLFGIPEIAQFMVNKGWLFGQAMCKTERYVLVFSLYSSVVTLVAVCVERWVCAWMHHY